MSRAFLWIRIAELLPWKTVHECLSQKGTAGFANREIRVFNAQLEPERSSLVPFQVEFLANSAERYQEFESTFQVVDYIYFMAEGESCEPRCKHWF